MKSDIAATLVFLSFAIIVGVWLCLRFTTSIITDSMTGSISLLW